MRAQVVVVQGDRILLARHQSDDRVYWVLPGGAVEGHEAPAEAAVREVREETGLTVRLDRLLFVDGPRDDLVVAIKRPRFTYLGTVIGGEMQAVEDSTGNSEANGRLVGAFWMPFDSPEYDAATRDTLALVKASLGDG
jgi:ADP-ribose pyrophosphatase YjhB (NUDIX family)